MLVFLSDKNDKMIRSTFQPLLHCLGMIRSNMAQSNEISHSLLLNLHSLVILRNNFVKNSLNIQTKTFHLHNINQNYKLAFRIRHRRNYHFPETAVNYYIYCINLTDLTLLNSDFREVLGKYSIVDIFRLQFNI